MIRLIVAALVIHIFSMIQVPADSVYMTESGHAEFTSRVPLHTFTGESDHLTGMIDPDSNRVDFYLDLSTLKTGIGKRDRDMYQTLNVDTHPFAEFTGTLDTPIDPDSIDKQTVQATGIFKLNGVESEKSIEGTIEKNGEGFRLEAAFTLSLDEFNIEPPGILFYRVNDIQKVEIRADLRPRERESVVN